MSFLKEIKIGKKKISNKHNCFVIAEAGVAHFGSLNKAYRLVDMAVEARADAIKFQLFKTNNLYSKVESPKWHKRMQSREISYKDYIKLINYCKKKKIFLFSTAHDEESLDFLIKHNQKVFKVGSGEIYNWPFINKIAKTKLPVILSTGMYDMADIKKVINIFKKNKNKKLIILYCVTSYPTNPYDIDLNFIKKLKNKFNVLTGYSDHTKGFNIPLAAVALGANVVEKHIALDFNVKNAQDWKVSLNNKELKKFIQELREIEKALKINFKKVSKNENLNKSWATKSIIYKKNLQKGEIVNLEHLIIKRPAGGILPQKINKLVNKKLKRSVKADTFVNFNDFK